MHKNTLSWDPTDERVGDILTQTDKEKAEVFLVGFPSDQGVQRNGGRIGAAQAPMRIRKYFYRLTLPENPAFRHLLEVTYDWGDFPMASSLEEACAQFSDTFAPHLRQGKKLILLGGGHETSYAHFLTYAKADLSPYVVNWDAHPDVRPLREGKMHSGSPFRQILEHPACRGYQVHGLLPYATAPAHLDYLREQGASFSWRNQLSLPEEVYEKLGSPLLVSFDCDCVDSAYAPGVSAPCIGGLTPHEAFSIAWHTGKSPYVTSIDLVECNPLYDVDDRTARLAAVWLWHLFSGMAQKLQEPI
ncbi:MAG: formimidoylglutamase [Bacteroidia bacterium]